MQLIVNTETPSSALERVSGRINIRNRYDNFIGGAWVPPAQGRYFDNLTPISGEVVCEIARSTAEDIETALDAAHAAAPTWGKTSPADRAAVLFKIADRMEAHLAELATVETIDNGKPIRETTAADIPLAVDHFRYFASCIRAQEGSISEIDETTVAYHFYEPLGVVGQIIPWNFPALMQAWKWGPALAAGCTIVLKPAEQTPLTALRIAELAQEAGVPDGVINVIPGFGPTAGGAIAAHPDVDKVAFTGSTEVGQLIMKTAAETNLKRVTLELGGKSPNIIFADADIAKASKFAYNALFFNMGQCCCAGSRLFVEDGVHDQVVETLTTIAGEQKLGDPFDQGTTQG
ncbi:MAG: aldehyde dehydrogenase family protein, partial [Hyphomicrobium sp.]